MALYQTYRPKDFHSVFGQTFVREVLQNALLQNRTVGVYLFHGSRGTGKTTVARILAKWVNCLSLTADGNPCGECQNCRDFEEGRLLDIIEIDAASNTGVDNIRDMIERAQFQPTQAPYKVYIIDEVHMLSKGAFNALLKTLEEPPKHVKFILATTEIHKIPDTIISRSQRYDFKRIKNEDIVDRLHFIAHAERIETEESALELIAKLAKWGLRDAITLFEQYSVGGVLKRKYIEENLELIGEDFLKDFIASIIKKDIPKTLEHLEFLREKSPDVRLFIEQLLSSIRDAMLAHLRDPDFHSYARSFEIFEGIYSRVKFTSDPFILLETSTFRLISDATAPAIASIVAPAKRETVIASKEKIAPVPEKSSATVIKDHAEKVIPPKEESSGSTEVRAPVVTGSNTPFDFPRFIEHVRWVPKRSFVGLWLRVSTYAEESGTIVIFPDNDFNFKKLDTVDVKTFLQEALDTLFWVGYQIDIRKGGTKRVAPSLADDAMDIF